MADSPLLDAISSAAMPPGGGAAAIGGRPPPPRERALNISGILWALWKSGRPEACWQVLVAWASEGVPFDQGTASVAAMAAEWQAAAVEALALEVAMLTSDAMQVPPALGGLVVQGAPRGLLPPALGGAPRDGSAAYCKLAAFLAFVEGELPPLAAGAAASAPNGGFLAGGGRRGGGAAAAAAAAAARRVLAAIEAFALRGSWLKVAGDAKAVLLEAALERSPAGGGQIAAELGTFVGYTAVRLAWRLSGAGARAVSLELDPVHVLLARHVAALAEQSAHIEIWAGLTYDTLARLPEAFGARPVSLVFMDHRGTRFHDDARALEQLGQFAAGGGLLADNVLKPGAPLCLWDLPRSGNYDATCWSLLEFLHIGVEDWMLLAALKPRSGRCL